MRDLSSTPAIDKVAIDALQDVLSAEHAALWCYSLAVAFLSSARAEQARSDTEAHRELRSKVAQTLTEFGQRPVSAQPAYATPQPVEDGLSAAALVVVAETDAMAAWRSVLERSTLPELRQVALDTLTATTVRCARWRAVVGLTPEIPVFPGRPDPPR